MTRSRALLGPRPGVFQPLGDCERLSWDEATARGDTSAQVLKVETWWTSSCTTCRIPRWSSTSARCLRPVPLGVADGHRHRRSWMPRCLLVYPRFDSWAQVPTRWTSKTTVQVVGKCAQGADQVCDADAGRPTMLDQDVRCMCNGCRPDDLAWSVDDVDENKVESRLKKGGVLPGQIVAHIDIIVIPLFCWGSPPPKQRHLWGSPPRYQRLARGCASSSKGWCQRWWPDGVANPPVPHCVCQVQVAFATRPSRTSGCKASCSAGQPPSLTTPSPQRRKNRPSQQPARVTFGSPPLVHCLSIT